GVDQGVDQCGHGQGTIHPSTVDCRYTSTVNTASIPRLHQISRRKMSPTLPTAAAATARFCGDSILPSTPADELVAAISTGCSPAWLAAVACNRPNSEFDEVSEPVMATPIQPISG